RYCQPCGRICGPAPDRREEHAELRSAARSREDKETGPPQARDERHPGRVPCRCRVHTCRGESACHSLRTGHPHIRDCHSQHPGSLDRTADQGDFTSAGYGRPFPRDRKTEPCLTHVQGSPCLRSPRRTGRGPSGTREGAVRRAAVAHLRRLRAAHGGTQETELISGVLTKTAAIAPSSPANDVKKRHPENRSRHYFIKKSGLTSGGYNHRNIIV